MSRIPAPICTWLTTDDWRAFIWFAVLFVVYLLIWLPFVKKYDAQLVEQEAKREAEQTAAEASPATV